MKDNTYDFEGDKISLFISEDMVEIKNDIEKIFKKNEKILPKDKTKKILIKPNFNNDLNSLTGNSTDLRIIISILESLKKRGFKNIIIGDGPNCGVDHIGIDVFSRLCIDKIAKMYNVRLLNLNYDKGRLINLVNEKAKIAESMLNSDFIINVPKLKTHVEAGITIACKNYIGCLKKTEKRKMHNNLHKNIIKLNEVIKTDLIIVDGLVGMEGRGPGDGIPKKTGIIISGHNPFLVDLVCSRLMGLNYNNIPFLLEAIKKKHICKRDILRIGSIEKIVKFKTANKTIFDKLLLNNFFIGIRFSKSLERLFNKGILPWILFKIGVKQDKYILEERNIKKLFKVKGLNSEQEKILEKCLEVYCPINLKDIDNKKCIKCMYCFQMVPDLIEVDGSLGDFKMQMKRFEKYVKNGG